MPQFQNSFQGKVFKGRFSWNFQQELSYLLYSIQSCINPRRANYPWLGTLPLNTLTGGQLVIPGPIFPLSAFQLIIVVAV